MIMVIREVVGDTPIMDMLKIELRIIVEMEETEEDMIQTDHQIDPSQVIEVAQVIEEVKDSVIMEEEVAEKMMK